MDAETYRLLSVISYIFTGLCFITAIVMFFTFRIPKAIGYVRKSNIRNVRKKHKAPVNGFVISSGAKDKTGQVQEDPRKDFTGTTVEENSNLSNEIRGTTVEEVGNRNLNEPGFRIIESVVIVHTDEKI